jgi:hypothetical protein
MAQGTQVNPKLIDPRLAALLGGQPSTGQQGPTGQPLTLADVIRGRDTARKDTNDMRQLMVTARAQGHPISLQQAMFAHAVNTGKPPQDPGSYAIAGLNPQDSPQVSRERLMTAVLGTMLHNPVPGGINLKSLQDLASILGGGGGGPPEQVQQTNLFNAENVGGNDPRKWAKSLRDSGWTNDQIKAEGRKRWGNKTWDEMNWDWMDRFDNSGATTTGLLGQPISKRSGKY